MFNWDLINPKYNCPYKLSDLSDETIKEHFDYEVLWYLDKNDIQLIRKMIKKGQSKNEIINKLCQNKTRIKS